LAKLFGIKSLTKTNKISLNEKSSLSIEEETEKEVSKFLYTKEDILLKNVKHIEQMLKEQ